MDVVTLLKAQKYAKALVDALEINAETYPGPEFIKRAKKAGAKFTIGVNNFTDNIRCYDRVWDMIEQCGLTADDFFRL